MEQNSFKFKVVEKGSIKKDIDVELYEKIYEIEKRLLPNQKLIVEKKEYVEYKIINII